MTQEITAMSGRSMAQWLGRQPVAAVDQAAVSRAQSYGVVLQVRMDYRMTFDDHGNRRGYVDVVRGCDLSLADGANLNAAHADVQRLLEPADARQIEGWLAELSVIVARRRDQDFAEELRVEAYASRLRAYPADVARHALLEHRWRFWPAWDELREVCDAKAAPRRAMVQRLAIGPRLDSPDTKPDRVTAERAAEILREVFADKRLGSAT